MFQALIEMYEYIIQNSITDLCDLLDYALSDTDDIKLDWLEVLQDDKLVDLLSCKINQLNTSYNSMLLRKYIDEFTNSCV